MAFPCRPLLPLSLALLVLCSTARADVRVVGTDPGAHVTIAAAISAAVDGDIILVREGDYPEDVVIDGKSLVIQADADAFVNVGSLTIRNLRNDQRVAVRGLTPRDFGTLARRSLLVEDCAGSVLIQEFETSVHIKPEPVLVSNSESVSLSLTTLAPTAQTGQPLVLVDSSTYLHDSTVWVYPSCDPITGVEVRGGFLGVYDSSVSGSNLNPFCQMGSSGFDIHLVAGAPLLQLHDSLVADVEIDSGSMENLPHSGRSYFASSPIFENDRVFVELRGESGDFVRPYFSAVPGAGLRRPFFTVPLFLNPPFFRITLGTLPPGGDVDLRDEIDELGPGITGFAMWTQALFLRPGEIVLSEPSVITFLDESFHRDGLVAPGYGWQATQTGSSSLGRSLAVADVDGDGIDDLLVGDPAYTGDIVLQGGVFLARGGPSGLEPSFSSAVTGTQMGGFGITAGFGTKIAAGDFDGDGFDDLVVGSFGYEEAAASIGRVDLYSGSASGLAGAPAWTLKGSGDLFGPNLTVGFWVESAGDVNADGFDDLLHVQNDLSGNYELQLILGGVGGLALTPQWTTTHSLSAAASSAGDVNGDGFDDVLVTLVGAGVQLHLGGASGIGGAPHWTFPSASTIGQGGDLDGDGFSDVVVADPLGGSSAGEIFLFRGSATGLPATPNQTIGSPFAGARFGARIFVGRDVDGDGLGDLLVTAGRFTHGHQDEGAAFLFRGSTTGIDLAPAQRIETNVMSAGGGAPVLGDFDGNGRADVGLGIFGSDEARVYYAD